MMKIFRNLLTVLVILCSAVTSHVQAQQDSSSKSISVFLNCTYGCYQDYLRTQITWVNFVQDQFVAEVDLLVASISTGSGGIDYTLYFNGRKQFDGMTDTLHFVTNAINTDAEVRELLSQKVKLGLVRYAARAGLGDQLLITSSNEKDIEDIGIGSNPDHDPYNAWVFRFAVDVNMDAQKAFQSGNFNGSINASQVKEKTKINLRASANYSEQRFSYGGIDGSFILRSQYAAGSYIHSLDEHWSAGVFTNIQISDFSNYDYYENGSLSLEYNVFPYKEAQTKLLTFGLSAGGTYFDFQDTTIFDKATALVPNASLSVGTSLTQTWGSLSGSIYAASFLNDFEKKRAGGWLNADVRLFKGFSLSSYVSFNMIRDQINIRKGGASDEQVLLQQQELQTSYNFYTYLGLSYRFGSIYNNVVNPRFDYGY